MAEKKPTTPKPTAADKRKDADDALNARIKARTDAAAAKKAVPSAKEAMAAANPLPPAVATVKAPWEQAVEKGAQQAVAAEAPKAKKERKPREAKPKVEASSDLSAMLEKVRSKAVAVADKAHAAEIKKLKAEHKAEVKALEAKHKADVVTMVKVGKSTMPIRLDKAHEAGIKVGEKRAHAAIKAALKGGA